MKIAASIICLNEANFIAGALNSIASFVDHIYLVDGGSTDGTREAFMAFCDEMGLTITAVEKIWPDHFGDQRQAALDLVPADVDWWFRIDADEQFSPLLAENIRSILAAADTSIEAIRIRQLNVIDDTAHYSAARGGWETHPRIFRNLRLPDGTPAWRWIGQVHEYCQLLTTRGLVYPEMVADWNAVAIHYGWLSRQRRQDREMLYEKMPGSGFKKGSLTGRSHIVKVIPECLL